MESYFTGDSKLVDFRGRFAPPSYEELQEDSKSKFERLDVYCRDSRTAGSGGIEFYRIVA